MSLPDPHSHADPAQGLTARLDLDLEVDFPSRTITGQAAFSLAAPAEGPSTWTRGSWRSWGPRVPAGRGSPGSWPRPTRSWARWGG